MEPTISLEIFVIVLLILANGVLAGAEIAIVSVRSTRLKELVERGVAWAAAAQALRDNPERFLATVQVGITVIGTTAGAFGGSTLAVHLIPVLQRIPSLHAYAEEIAVGAVVVLISFLSIVVGELVPKSLALRAAEPYARLIARPLLGLSSVSRPAVRLLAASSNLVLKLFGDRTSFTEARLSTEELRHLVEDAAKVGSIHPSSSSIASRALEFGELRVLDVMVPRVDVVCVTAGATLDEVTAQLERTPFSRLPVQADQGEDILGYLAAKDLISRRGLGGHALDLLRPGLFVPESLSAVQLLEQLQRERQQLALVVDEQGSFAGIVTMEDLLEELVGEIFSEFRAEQPAELAWHQGAADVPAATPLRLLNRALDLDLEEGPTWTTLGGLILQRLGRIPAAGEAVALSPDVQAEVLEVKGPRVLRVRLSQ